MRDLVDEHIELWSRELPDLDPRVEGIVTRLQVLDRHLRHELEQALATQSLKMWEFKTLHILRRGGPPYRATATELAGHNRPEVLEAMRGQVSGMQPMGAEDIADMITYIVTRPRHVAVNEVLIRPTEQA